jgi:hypothetical protein
MIPVKIAKEPTDFKKKVKIPGLRAISEMVGQVPNPPRTAGKAFKKIARTKKAIPSTAFPAYWTEALDDLMKAYNQICAYSAFRIHPITGARSADHMIPKSVEWREVYEWRNYRLACSRLNSRKNDFQDVLDPFKIKPDWFVLNILTFEVEAGKNLDANTTKQIEDTIARLNLNDLKREREEYASDYWAKEVSLKILKREAPFIAYELFRQKKLNAGDKF